MSGGKRFLFSIYAYTIKLKSKVGTSGYQLFPTFFAFSESANQTEWEKAQGAMKSRKSVKMGHPTLTLRVILLGQGFSYHSQHPY